MKNISAFFEGETPEEKYGARKVEIFDKGNYRLIEKKENKIVFELEGKNERDLCSFAIEIAKAMVDFQNNSAEIFINLK